MALSSLTCEAAKCLRVVGRDHQLLGGIKFVRCGPVCVQIATLKATFGDKYPYSKPFPYEKKKFNVWSAFYDKTVDRFNENTKVVVIEGNMAVGKKEFAKRFAKGFDLKYFPPTRDDHCYMDAEYGHDLRKTFRALPPHLHLYDLERFYADPHPEKGMVGNLQLHWYEQRFHDYCTALKHLMNTGQGVVLVRSAFSDSVFVEALRRMGWVTPQFSSYYKMSRANTICELFKPHLTIYLDAPVSKIRERINQRKDPREIHSKQLSDQYLTTIEQVYKEVFLPEMRRYGEVVEVNWTEVADDMDMDAMLEELQHVELEPEHADDMKFSDWSRVSEDEWAKYRQYVDSKKAQAGTLNTPAPYECPELFHSQEDIFLIQKVLAAHPVYRYLPGWAPEFGHRTLLRF